jgi:quercetin dioxygenase-like cupin family protein
MPLRITFEESEILPRLYGTMRRLAVAAMGLQNHQLLFMTIEPQQITSRHYHPQEEIYFVLSGSPIFRTESADIQAQPFDTVIFLANEIHQVFNPSPCELCECVLAISPLYDPKDVTHLAS